MVQRIPPVHAGRSAQYAEPVIGRRFAPTRWLLRPTKSERRVTLRPSMAWVRQNRIAIAQTTLLWGVMPRSAARQHFLNFLPLPHGQGSLRPILRNGLDWGSYSEGRDGNDLLRVCDLGLKQCQSDNSAIVSPNRLRSPSGC